MPAEAHVWWSEVDDVRERIERRRAREVATASRRGVREVVPVSRATLVGTHLAPARDAPRRTGGARRRAGGAGLRLGAHPDRLAAWAVALGFLLVLLAGLSAHG